MFRAFPFAVWDLFRASNFGWSARVAKRRCSTGEVCRGGDVGTHLATLPCHVEDRASRTHSSASAVGMLRICSQNLSLRGSSPPPLVARNQSRIASSPSARRSQVIALQSPRSSIRRITKPRCSTKLSDAKSQSQNSDLRSSGNWEAARLGSGLAMTVATTHVCVCYYYCPFRPEMQVRARPPNSKHKARNSKQIQMTETGNHKRD